MRIAAKIFMVLVLAWTRLSSGADWAQLQNGPQHPGRSAEALELPLKNAWCHGFSPERLHPQAQPIVAGGRVFIGTEMGTFYAFDSGSGKELWTFKAGPILHTAATEGGKVFFADLDGHVYALDAATGARVWMFDSEHRTGFSTAVLLAEQRVFVVNRGGVCYALDQADGKPRWKRELGAPVLMSPAWDRGKLFVPAMDMRVYALESSTGAVAWKSETLPGAAFKDYWPVVYNDVLLIRPQRISGGASGNPIEWQTGPLPEPDLAKQQVLLAQLEKNPGAKNLFVLDPGSGKEAFTVPQWITNTMNGAVAPPCVDGDGMLIAPVTLHDWRGGWGRLDLEKRRIVEVLVEDQTNKGNRRGTGNTDENLLVSSAGRLVLTFHTEEMNAHFTGVWHLDQRTWTPVGPIHRDRAFSSNTQGGGGSAPVIAGGMVFHTSWNNLNARTAAAQEAKP